MRKGIVALLTVVLLMLPVTVLAAGEADVWMESSMVDSKATITVVSNGETASGVVTLKYDAKVFDCDVAKIVAANGVAMHSVNVVEDGTLMISYLAAENIPAGTMFTVELAVSSEASATEVEAAMEALKLSGEVYDNAGESETVGEESESESESESETESETQSESETETQTESESETEDEPSDPDTGDKAPIMLFAAVVVAGAGVVYFGLKKKTNIK